MNNNLHMPSSDARGVIAFGFAVIFIVFVLMGGWMSVAQLAASSVAVGNVSADYDKKTVQHLEGGIIEKIYVKDGDYVNKDDVIIKLQDIHIKGQLLQIRKQINGLTSLIQSKERRLSSIKEEIQEWSKLFKEQLVDKLRIRELQREENSIEGDISNTKAEIAKLEEQTIVIEDILSRTKIVSPASGIVIGMNLNTVGGVVAPGKPILEIVPKESKLIVVAKIKTADIDKVHVGLLADIRFSAFNLNQAHVVEGKVIHVSADNFIDEASKEPYYETKIQVTPKGMEQLNEYQFTLVAGMPAEVMIRIGERTALSYFVKPFTDMLSRGFNEE